MSSHPDRLDNVSRGQPRKASKANTSSAIKENYLSHPVFGLLINLCIIDTQSALYTSLYAKRLFFLVTATEGGLEMDSISRDEARVALEKRLVVLRKSNFYQEYDQLKEIYKNTFSR
ncbi:PipX family protein [Acaryochloris sp. IP29b_bin.137]|uniref:PipX family protein n=1 Tax=Acaryochloris sp. IP29b_bin.137 TaxID=2969217 RepID=UPI00260EFED7|nr:PipX family protein [Acaryochloris sp. IP29b_bin.137]